MCISRKTIFAKVKVVRSDNGLEFNIVDFYAEKRILHQKTCVETPQQNAIAERKHQHILNVVRALRFQLGLPLEFWGHCILHATYLINMLPSLTIQWRTPFEMLFKKAPKCKHLKVFGCLCFASALKRSKTKKDERGRMCIFIGYPANFKGYILYDLKDHSTFISRYVYFYETNFPFKEDAG